MKNKIIGFIFLMILALCSCKMPYAPEQQPDVLDEHGGFTLVDNLFVDNGSGTTEFSTNNPQYWSEHGYTLWTLPSGQDPMIPFTSRTVRVAKTHGNASSGFGIIICQGTRDGYGETMLTVMINLNKHYTVGKVIGGSYTPIVPWTYYPSLTDGYGITTELKVTYDAGTQKFTLWINGENAQTFESTDPIQIAGKSGYIVVVSPEDSFPEDNVTVFFTE